MAAYDNIGSAYVMIQDGAWRTISMTTRGATYETNEKAEVWSGDDGRETTWMALDLRAVDPGDTVLVSMAGKLTEGDEGVFGESNRTWWPMLSIWYDSQATTPVWDPASPDFGPGDFSLQNFQSFTPSPLSFGQLGNNRPYFVTFDMEFPGGTRYYFSLTAQSQRFSAPFLYGTAEISYAVNWTSYSSDITVDVSPSASVVSGDTVRENRFSNTFNFSSPYTDFIGMPYTFRVSGAQLPPAGRYRVTCQMREQDAGVADVFCTIRRNGYPLGVSQPTMLTGLTGSFTDRTLTDLTPFGGYTDDVLGPTAIPVLAGDTFEFAFFNGFDDASPSAENFDIKNLKWWPLESGGQAGPEIKLLDIPELPAGASDYSTIPNIEDINHVSDSFYNIQDMVVLDNDDVHCFFHADSGATATKDIIIHTLFSGGTWSLVTNDPCGIGGGGVFPSSSFSVGSIHQWSVGSDGTDIWLVHGICTSIHGTGYPNYEIRVRKYSSGTWSTVGSAIQPLAPGTFASQPGGYNHGKPQIKISPGGVPWITFGQNDPTVLYTDTWTSKVFAYFWNGSAWTDAGLPQPTNPHPSTPGPADAFIDVAVVQDYPRSMVQMTFAGAGGPSENPSVLYMAYYDSDDWPESPPPLRFAEWYYQEYQGTPSSWSTPDNFLISDYYPPGAEYVFRDGEDYTSSSEIWHQGLTFSHNDDGPIIAASLGGSSSYIGGLVVLHMVGGQWAPYHSLTTTDLPSGPLDKIYLWVDPGGAEMAVDSEGLPFITFQSNPAVFGWTNPPILQPRETGTGDGHAWSCLTRTVGFDSEIDAPPRMIAKGTTLYYLDKQRIDTVDGVALNYRNRPLLWIIPRSTEVHIPWKRGIIPQYGSIKRP